MVVIWYWVIFALSSLYLSVNQNIIREDYNSKQLNDTEVFNILITKGNTNEGYKSLEVLSLNQLINSHALSVETKVSCIFYCVILFLLSFLVFASKQHRNRCSSLEWEFQTQPLDPTLGGFGLTIF